MKPKSRKYHATTLFLGNISTEKYSATRESANVMKITAKTKDEILVAAVSEVFSISFHPLLLLSYSNSVAYAGDYHRVSFSGFLVYKTFYALDSLVGCFKYLLSHG